MTIEMERELSLLGPTSRSAGQLMVWGKARFFETSLKPAKVDWMVPCRMLIARRIVQSPRRFRQGIRRRPVSRLRAVEWPEQFAHCVGRTGPTYPDPLVGRPAFPFVSELRIARAKMQKLPDDK